MIYIKKILRDGIQAIKEVIGRRNPTLFFIAYRLFGKKNSVHHLLLKRNTEIVIEGFPRSGNTYAVVAFQMAQERPVQIAHHLHAEAQIIRGVQMGLPVIVLIREPVGAVKSLLVRYTDMNWEAGMRHYINFYSEIEKLKDRVVVADFNLVISDFNAVLKKVNAKYGVDYKSYLRTAENESRVFDRIRQINDEVNAGLESYVAIPSDYKKSKRNQIAIDVNDPLVTQAMEMYRKMIA